MSPSSKNWETMQGQKQLLLITCRKMNVQILKLIIILFMFGAKSHMLLASLLWETDSVNVSEQCWILYRVYMKLKMLDIQSTTHWHFYVRCDLFSSYVKTKEAGTLIAVGLVLPFRMIWGAVNLKTSETDTKKRLLFVKK